MNTIIKQINTINTPDEVVAFIREKEKHDGLYININEPMLLSTLYFGSYHIWSADIPDVEFAKAYAAMIDRVFPDFHIGSETGLRWGEEIKNGKEVVEHSLRHFMMIEAEDRNWSEFIAPYQAAGFNVGSK